MDFALITKSHSHPGNNQRDEREHLGKLEQFILVMFMRVPGDNETPNKAAQNWTVSISYLTFHDNQC